ncbi:hypothetical protein [Ruminococcus sp. HUN007]|uniref:hypothetical protein n=1 Tax=Ruminococcus sp. HUN007 TaxID=1514668 RepID=UPI0005D14994|nr:hypothetical protein [Ruminococcus sp. HUN007]
MKYLKKLIPVYGGFLLAVVLIYSRFGLHLINGNPLRTAAGIVIMLLMIGLVIYLTISALQAAKISELPAIETKAPVSEVRRLEEFTDFYRRMAGANLGPFESRKRDIYDLCVSMKQKNDNIRKLLRDSFSTEDLTYNTYMSTLDEVMKIFNNNLGGIKKRIEVFDYKNWSDNRNDEHADEYISEVDDLYQKNYVVIDHIDDLMHELVNLDDISDVPLEKVTRLVEQTQNYKKIKERQM